MSARCANAPASSRVAKGTGVTVFRRPRHQRRRHRRPRVLEHIVDAVLYLEGDPFHKYRLLRSVKNRFGATNEVGVLKWCRTVWLKYLIHRRHFLAERQANAPGSAIAVTMEGTRLLLVEIQAWRVRPLSPTRAAQPMASITIVCYCRCIGQTRRIKLFDKDGSSTPSAACKSTNRRPTWQLQQRSRAAPMIRRSACRYGVRR